MADNLPQTVGASQLPAGIEEFAERDAGSGVSTRAEDNLVPLIYVLQDGSPQVKERDEDYIVDAKAGDIWLRASLDPIAKGGEGIWAQPCAFYTDVVEWIPRKKGGGFVARHDVMPSDVKETADEENPNRVVYVRPNGNECRETRYHVVNVFGRGTPQPYVIPLSGTGHTFSRQWMFMMNGVQIKDKKAPSFSRLYNIKTKLKTNAAGEWFTFTIADSQWVPSLDAYNAGKALFDAFERGEKKAEAALDAERASDAAEKTAVKDEHPEF